MGLSLKYKILVVFTLIAISLLLIIFTKKPADTDDTLKLKIEEPPKQTADLSNIKLNLSAEIDSVLYSYGIKKEWIKNKNLNVPSSKDSQKKKEKVKQSDVQLKSDLWFDKEIILPTDIPQAELNLSITHLLNSKALNSTVREDAKTRNLSIDIFAVSDSTKKITAKMKFTTSAEINREEITVCIIIDNIENRSKEEREKILRFPDRFSILMPTNIENAEVQNEIKDSKKDFLIELTVGSEKDETADLATYMREKDWKAKVKSYYYEFSKASGIILLNPSKEYLFENNIRNEFQKLGMNILTESLYDYFRTTLSDSTKISVLLKEITEKAKKTNKPIIYISEFTFTEFEIFANEIIPLKRKGYKFINYSDYLKKATLIQENKTQERQDK